MALEGTEVYIALAVQEKLEITFYLSLVIAF